jgi:hypothetical protein
MSTTKNQRNFEKNTINTRILKGGVMIFDLFKNKLFINNNIIWN